MDNLEKIIMMISKNLEVPVEQLSEDTDIREDLDADSLDLVELAMSMEDEFDITLDDDVVAGLRTIGDIVEVVDQMEENR